MKKNPKSNINIDYIKLFSVQNTFQSCYTYNSLLVVSLHC